MQVVCHSLDSVSFGFRHNMIMMSTVETRVITLIHIHDSYYWGKGRNSVGPAVSRELVKYCSCFRVLVIVSSVEVVSWL